MTEIVELTVPTGPVLRADSEFILRAALLEGVIEEGSIDGNILKQILEETDTTPQKTENFQSAIFMPEAVKITFGNGMEKYISYQEFLRVLTSIVDNTQVTTKGGESFMLPSNVFFFSHSSTEVCINTYYTARDSHLKFIKPDTNKATSFDITMPNLILAITLTAGRNKKDWRVTGSKYFCTDLPVSKLPKNFINSVRHSDHVFLMPMSNTYGEGNMCTGGNTMPSNMTENNLRALDWYYQYMWESPFNSDLGVRALKRNMEVHSWYDLLKKKAEKKEPFPYDLLTGWSAI